MSAPAVAVDLLGPPQLRLHGKAVEIPGSRKTRALLGYLLLQDRPVSRQHLCEWFWPTPNDPRAALRWSLSKLRPVLDAESPHLRADRMQVSITGLDDAVDIRRIEACAGEKRRDASTEDLEALVERVHGELLEGHELPDCHRFHDWLQARRESFRRAHRALLEELVERHGSDAQRSLVFARALASLEPFEEAHQARVIRLLQRLGRLREARRQFDHCLALFEDELGVTPSDEFLRLLSSGTVADTPPTPTRRSPSRIETSGTSSAGLFGRIEECTRIEGFLEAASAGETTPILLFEGEAGIGKTRLLEELGLRAAAQSIPVLTGRSWEAEIVRPLAPWSDLLERAQTTPIPDSLRKDLAALLPSVAEGVPDAVDQARLFRAVFELLRAWIPPNGAMVLTFDDLQWIDPMSAALLSFITRRAPAGVAIACAGRNAEFADSEPARALLKSWTREGRLRRVEVRALDDRDAAALARAIRGKGSVESIVRRCGGNPLYLIGLAQSHSTGLPEQLRGVLLDRIDALDPDAREVAQWLAVLGRQVPTNWLERLVAQDTSTLLHSIDELQRRGILVRHGRQCDFAHDLMRTTTYGSIPGAQRSILHRHVARMLDAEATNEPALAADVAYHAQRGGDRARTVRASIAAAEHALRLAARDEAYTLARRALYELGRGEPIEGDLEQRAALLRILVHAGLGRRNAQALAKRLRRLAEDARRTRATSVERMACYLLSIVHEEAGDFDRARDYSLRAEQAGRESDATTRLAALANTARCLVQLERDPPRARALLGEAETLAIELGTHVVDLAWGRGLLHALEGDTDAARAALTRGAELARDKRDHWAEFECLAGLSQLDLENGDNEAVLRRDPELRAVAARLGEGSDLPFATILRALASARLGPASELEAALTSLRQADTKGRLAYALNVAAEDDLRAGRLRLASARAAEAFEAAESVGRPVQMARARAVQGLVAIARGDRPEAERQRERIAADLDRLGPHVGARAQWVRLDLALTRDPTGTDRIGNETPDSPSAEI